MFWKKKKNQEELQKSGQEEEWRFEEQKKEIFAIIENLPDGLLIFDRTNKLSFINRQAQVLLGISSKKILRKHILELTRIPNIQPLVALLGGGIKETSREEVKINENLILEVSSTPLFVQDNQKIGTLVILHNITRQEEMEKMKSEFITVAAHQLRTPTSAIKWILQSFLEENASSLTETQKEAIEKAYKINERVISLVSNLLNVVEIEEGKYLSDVSLTDIREIIKSTIEDYQEKLKENKIKLIYNPPKELPELMLDKEKIKTVFSDLIDNALRYTRPGGWIKIIINKPNKEIEIQIKDNGIGIPKNEQSKIFSKFYRASNALKVYTDGKGLGLFIARNIIEAHGGKIWFESEENKGTAFYISLPVKEKFAEYLTKEFY